MSNNEENKPLSKGNAFDLSEERPSIFAEDPVFREHLKPVKETDLEKDGKFKEPRIRKKAKVNTNFNHKV